MGTLLSQARLNKYLKMFKQNLIQTIQDYKVNFEKVHKAEIYKWKAIKHFQENWDIGADDFKTMLKSSFAKAKNLMDAGSYYPRRMLYQFADFEPALIKSAFQNLYNEAIPLLDRRNHFKVKIDRIMQQHFADDKNSYQDDRALMLYLSLKYPESYFLYKYEMFLNYSRLIEYPYKPIRGRFENVLQYNTLCEILKSEVVKDQDLLKMHKGRIDEDTYFDVSSNVLVQDIIYANVTHIHKESKPKTFPSQKNEKNIIVTTSNSSSFQNNLNKIAFNASVIDFEKQQKQNKILGDMGEYFVMEFERKNLTKKSHINKLEHSAKSQGDGLGFDIKSVTSGGDAKFIEVKTTTGSLDTPFFITNTELQRSIQERENYYLYRVYDFDVNTQTGKIEILKGSLENLCDTPTTFKVKLSKI